MPYLLRLSTNGYAQLASTFSVAGTSSLSIKFKAAFTSGVTSEVYGLGTSTAERLQYNGTGFFFRLNGTNGNTITTATIASLVPGYSVSNANEYELRKILFEDGTRTRYRLFVNGVDCGILMSIFGSGGDTFQFSRIGSASTTFMNGDLYYMDCFVDGVKTRSYDPSATGGGGSTLVDTTGSQNGTLNGTYSWIFYSSGTSFEGTIGKTTLTPTTQALSLALGSVLSPNKQTLSPSVKQLSINTGLVLSPNKQTISVSNKQLGVVAGVSLGVGKQALILNTKPEFVQAGAVVTNGKQAYPLATKQLSVVVGANVPFTATINKSSYSLSGKQLAVQAGWNNSVSKDVLTVQGKQESVNAGALFNINEQQLTLSKKGLSLVTGTSISFVGELNKANLNSIGKPLSVVTGTSIPFTGTIQKTSLTLSGKALTRTNGHILEIQKQSLNLVTKQLSIGETIYPIIPVERLFTIKDGDRVYLMKQTTTIYIMKNN